MAVVLGLLASPLVACATEAMESAEQQMACCRSGHQDCGTAVKPADCCTHSETHSQQLGASKVELVTKIGAPVASWTHPASLSTLEASLTRCPVGAARAPIDTSPPDCIAFSALLI